MPKTEARLQTAYVWDCDECGAENFGRPMRADPSPEEKEEAYRHFHDLDAWAELPERWEDFELLTRPSEVTCGECGETFPTVND